MSGRYSIIVREYSSDHDVELCRVGSNPDAIAAAAKQKILRLRGGRTTPKYTSIRIQDNGASA